MSTIYKYVVENFTNQSVQVDSKVADVEFYAEPTASIDKPTNLTNNLVSAKCKG